MMCMRLKQLGYSMTNDARKGQRSSCMTGEPIDFEIGFRVVEL